MKKIILRLDLNVPLKKNGEIVETERIDIVLSEIKSLAKNNKLIILSHLGKGEEKDSLINIEKYLRNKLTKKENANIEVLENTRFIKGETAKKGSKEFKEASKYFASLGEEYINNAFSVMHREHASIVGIPEIFKKENKKVKLGELAKKEIKSLEKSLALSKKNKKETLLILSGAKTSTKLPLIQKFLSLGATVFVGGGLANQIFKDILNLEIGKSFFEKDLKLSSSSKEMLLKAIKTKQLILPIDSILKSNKVELVENLKKQDYLVDIGPATLILLKNKIEKSKNIILNGPLGLYEEGFTLGTEGVLKILKKSKANILIGGGDTLFLVKKLKIKKTKNINITTSGGAMLEFLINEGDLPGISILKNK